jgi:hypothetical protein
VIKMALSKGEKARLAELEAKKNPTPAEKAEIKKLKAKD